MHISTLLVQAYNSSACCIAACICVLWLCLWRWLCCCWQAMKHDPGLHGYLGLSFLAAMNASTARERQMQFLHNPGVHNIQSQLVLSNATLDACYADLQSATCTRGMQADLDSYALIGFTQHHGAFAEDLIRLACQTAAGVNASSCSIHGKAVSAAALRNSTDNCCWVLLKFVCNVPECDSQSRARDEELDLQAADLAKQLNGLDVKLYGLALAMLAGGQHTVFRPSVRAQPVQQMPQQRRFGLLSSWPPIWLGRSFQWL